MKITKAEFQREMSMLLALTRKEAEVRGQRRWDEFDPELSAIFDDCQRRVIAHLESREVKPLDPSIIGWTSDGTPVRSR